MQDVIDKAAILIEALPYIRSFAGKTVVIKYGGAAMAAADLQTAIMQDIALMKFCGMNPIVVHGGGPEISAFSKAMGLEPTFIDGLRVTDAATMNLVQMVLLGKTNREIVMQLNRQGVRAMGLSGQDAAWMQANKLKHRLVKTGELVDLGFVGEINKIDAAVIEKLIKDDFIPVIAPIAVGADHQAYNVNADVAAGAIAAALQAEKLVFLTDVEGIRQDKNNPDSVMSRLTASDAKQWIQEGQCDGGMIPKLEACCTALTSGTNRVHIIDGRVPHSLLLEIFTDRGIGTMVVN